MGTVITILVAIFVFGILIFVHELGHFITAKLSGIQVNEFAMGMGPKLLSFGKGETVYSLRLFPVGGFCAMEGEDEESPNERAFGNVSWGRRFLVMAAGSLMNLLLGLLILIYLTTQSSAIASTTISQFASNAKSSQQLMTGDKIVRINGHRVRTGNDLQYEFTRSNTGVLDIEVIRGGETVALDRVEFHVREVAEDVYMPIFDFSVMPIEKTFGNVITDSVNWTGSLVKQVWGSLIDLITGRYGLSELSGPVGVTTVIGEAASSGYEAGAAEGGFWAGFSAGLQNVLMLMAFISVNLGVFNLLPLPALDGGKIFFLLIEAVRRKPVPAKYEGWVHAVGFFLLIGLIVVVSIKDILSLF